MNKIITILVVLFSIQGVLAADTTPPPPTPPPPPGLPIDGGIVVLFVLEYNQKIQKLILIR